MARVRTVASERHRRDTVTYDKQEAQKQMDLIAHLICGFVEKSVEDNAPLPEVVKNLLADWKKQRNVVMGVVS